MDTLRDEIKQANEAREIDQDTRRNARVRAMQLDLAADVETCRGVPTVIKALDQQHRAVAREALETLEQINLSTLQPQQGGMVDTLMNRLKHVLTLFEQGPALAERAVGRVDDLTHEQIKSWSPPEYARGLRNDLQGASSAPQIIKAIMEGLALDMKAIKTMMTTGEKKKSIGAAPDFGDRPVPLQRHAHSNTQYGNG